MACVVQPLPAACDMLAERVTIGNIRIEAVAAPAPGSNAEWFPGAEELLAIDAMAGPTYTNVFFDMAVLELEILSPPGCTFATPGPQAIFLPYALYEMFAGGGWVPFTANSSRIRVTRWEPPATVPPVTVSPVKQVELNDGNSLSYWLGMKGRGNSGLGLKASVTASGSVRSIARSCDWEIRELKLGDQLPGRAHKQQQCP